MYPCHEPRLTPEEQMLDDWLRIDNHFLARALSLTHHDDDHAPIQSAAHSPRRLVTGTQHNTPGCPAKESA